MWIKHRKKIKRWACYNRIWSWSPMPCEKHGPRASVTTKTSAFGLGFCLLSPSGHVFHTAWETMIKSYTMTLTTTGKDETMNSQKTLHTLPLTHWGRDKMAAIFQTTYSNAFSQMKTYELRSKFHCSFVPRGPINNIPALIQITVWHRPGDKPLSESLMTRLSTHICVTRPHWVKGKLWSVFWICGYFAVNVIKRIPCRYILYLGQYHTSGLILGLRRANEWRRNFVTTSLIGSAQA